MWTNCLVLGTRKSSLPLEKASGENQDPAMSVAPGIAMQTHQYHYEITAQHVTDVMQKMEKTLSLTLIAKHE